MKPLFSRLAGRHLDDAALAAIWTSMTAAGASVTAGASDPHLASCGECRVRCAARGGRDLHPGAARGSAGGDHQAPRSCRASGPRDRISEVLIEHHRTIRPGSALDRRRGRRRPSRRAWSREAASRSDTSPRRRSSFARGRPARRSPWRASSPASTSPSRRRRR